MNSVGVIDGNGYSICSGSWDYTVRLWYIETTKELTIFKGHEDTLRSVKYSPHETNTMCSGSVNKKYLPFVNNNNNNGDGTSIINSNIICSGSDDNTIRFWNIRNNRQLHVIKGNENKDENVSKKTDDSVCNVNLCYGSYKGPIRIWG
ncbi:WD repeat-containing protein [Reticulomyxa filosa]|uniref:WD repeat-containing protein n=1 Tax=Reticulomyxa filosa TaxID=46433 RepID=X6M116_RETFI|nr:WD repeat-containing protein [Reticulomyxa filosa]|eukprot:ETO07564.1 WD repeat-containing protein [Reticulomyxa filosa]